MSVQIWQFLGPPSTCPGLSRPVHIWFTTPLPPVHADTRLALFETLQLVNNSHWRVKKLIILFENNIKNIWMKTVFEMSIHCVPYILYWIQAEWKLYIQTYCQIIWVNFTSMVPFFFPSGRPHLANHPLPLSTFVHFCLTPPLPTLMCGHPLWMAHHGEKLFKTTFSLREYYFLQSSHISTWPKEKKEVRRSYLLLTFTALASIKHQQILKYGRDGLILLPRQGKISPTSTLYTFVRIISLMLIFSFTSGCCIPLLQSHPIY